MLGFTYMLQFQYDPDILTQVVSLLAPYDPGDLLETVAGLQLLPENADRTIRLEALAHTVASLANTQGKPTIGLPRLKQIAASGPLGQGPIASQEDPFNASFTEAFLFHGGTYVVFPGIAEDSTFILRHLAHALFLLPEPFPNSQFMNEAAALLSAVLVLSNEIARRAGLGRGVEPRSSSSDGGLYVPDVQRITRLREAVSFSQSELAFLLAEYDVLVASLELLIVSRGEISVNGYQDDNGTPLTHPLVQIGDQLVAAIPSTLLTAVRHALINLACEYGVEDELAKRYHRAVWETVVTSLGYLHNPLLPLQLPELPCLQHACFRLNTDKVYDNLQRLATFDVAPYTAPKP